MKSFFLLLLCLPLFAQQSTPRSAAKPINDAAVMDRFEQEIDRLLKTKKTVVPKTIENQLKGEPRPKITIKSVPAGLAILPPAKLYERLRPSVMLVGDVAPCPDCPKNHGDLAGGVAIASNLVLTAYHVLEVGDAPVVAQGVMTHKGEVFPVKRVIAADQANDVAIIEVGGGSLVPAPISKGDRVGEPVTAISHPAGRYFMLTHGRIARFATYALDPEKPKLGSYEAMEITADFAYGSSGCPVFNQRGEVCGIIVTTESIYYEETRRRQTDLQMVIKACTPISAIRGLMKAR